MDLNPVIARLRLQMTGLKAVGGSADLAAAVELAPATPALYVVPLAERADPGTLVNVARQCVHQTFGVILVVSNRRDATGAASLTDLEGLRLQLRTALLGWVPVPAEGWPCEFSAGRLLRWDDGRLWWSDEWSVDTWWTGA